jgi:hypothetical protein
MPACGVCGKSMVSFKRKNDVEWLCPNESEHGKIEAQERQRDKGDHRKTGERGHTGVRDPQPDNPPNKKKRK